MEYMITELKQIGGSEKYKMYLDYSYKCDLMLETIYKYHLKDSVFLSDEQLDEIVYESQKLTCFSTALNYVSKVQKTEKQVSDYLIKKGYLPELVEFAIVKLKEYKYLDDVSFAKNYISYYSPCKGKKLLEYELRLKGISEEVLLEVFDGFCDNCENIAKIIKKKAKIIQKPLDFKQRDKIIRSLASKGFDFADIRNAMEQLNLDAEDSE